MKQRLASKGLGVGMLFKRYRKAFRPPSTRIRFGLKLRVFPPISKKSASTRCVFQLVLLVLTNAIVAENGPIFVRDMRM